MKITTQPEYWDDPLSSAFEKTMKKATCEHESVIIQDDSFDHVFGTQKAISIWCKDCGEYLGNDREEYSYDC